MKNGFILPLVILIILGSGGFWLFAKYSKVPNSQTQAATKTIIKYPNSQKWQVKNTKALCIIDFENCSPVATIHFESSDGWQAIYAFFRNVLPAYGWVTKSQILTSIPTAITFTNEISCQADLIQQKEKFFRFLNKSDINLNLYKFSVTCPTPMASDIVS